MAERRTRNDSESSGYGEKKNLFVKNIDPSVSEANIICLFQKFGVITSAKIQKNRGFGFVEFESHERAAAAIKGLHNFKLGSKQLYVDYFQSRDERSLLLAGIHLMKVNLFVQNLDKSIDHQQLEELFSPYGKVISVRIDCRYKSGPTNNGFVCYSSKAEAESAIHCLNGCIIRDRKITVKEHNKAALQKQENNLRVENLSPAITDSELHHMFAKFGTIKSAKVMVNNRKCSKGYGYVCFENKTQAEMALNEMDNAMRYGMRLSVSLATKGNDKRSEGGSSDDDMSENGDLNMGSRIFVKNLEHWMDEETLKHMFSHFGGISSTEILRENGDSLCCGTVTFLKPRDAREAIQKMNGLELTDGVFMEVQFDDSPPHARTPNKSGKTLLYIKELDPRVTVHDLKNYFGNFGLVKSAKIDETHHTSNVGHIDMSTHEEAMLAVEEADGSCFYGRNLFVTLHMSKEEREEFKQRALIERLKKIALGELDDSGTNGHPNDLNCSSQAARPKADSIDDEVNERSRRVRAKSAVALNRKKMNLQPFDNVGSEKRNQAGVMNDAKHPTRETRERKAEPNYSNLYGDDIHGPVSRSSRESRSRKQKSRPKQQASPPRHYMQVPWSVGNMPTFMTMYDANRNVTSPSKPLTYEKPLGFGTARSYYGEYEGPPEPRFAAYNVCNDRYAYDEAARLDLYHQSGRPNGRSRSTVAQRLFRK